MVADRCSRPRDTGAWGGSRCTSGIHYPRRQRRSPPWGSIRTGMAGSRGNFGCVRSRMRRLRGTEGLAPAHVLQRRLRPERVRQLQVRHEDIRQENLCVSTKLCGRVAGYTRRGGFPPGYGRSTFVVVVRACGRWLAPPPAEKGVLHARGTAGVRSRDLELGRDEQRRCRDSTTPELSAPARIACPMAISGGQPCVWSRCRRYEPPARLRSRSCTQEVVRRAACPSASALAAAQAWTLARASNERAVRAQRALKSACRYSALPRWRAAVLAAW